MPEPSQTLLKRLIELVEAQTREIKALREEVRALKPPEPPLPRARIEPDTGYEYMGLCLYLDARTWAAISGSDYWQYGGETLTARRLRLENEQ